MGLAALPIGLGVAGAATKGIGAALGTAEANKQNRIKKIQTAWSPWTGKTPQEYTQSPSMLGSIIGGGVEGAQTGFDLKSNLEPGIPFGAVSRRPDGVYIDKFGNPVYNK
jgi:hypothetical protein